MELVPQRFGEQAFCGLDTHLDVSSRTTCAQQGSLAGSAPQNMEPSIISAAPNQAAIQDDFSLTLELEHEENPLFTGREDVLEDIDDILASKNGYALAKVVLLGIGGVGKTQIARRYAYAYQDNHSSISWINAKTLETTYASFLNIAQRLIRHYASISKEELPQYAKIAQHLGMNGMVDSDGQIKNHPDVRNLVITAVKAWVSKEGNASWLLIFDNVDDFETFDIQDFFPPSSAVGSIIFTTRRKKCAKFGTLVEVDLLQEEESIAFLQKSCKRKSAFRDRGKCSHSAQEWLSLTFPIRAT